MFFRLETKILQTKKLGETFQKIPFLRITIAFSIGVILASKLAIPPIYLFAIIPILFTLLIIIHRNYTFRFNHLFGSGIQILFVLTGIIVYLQYNKMPPFAKQGTFVATVLEIPQEKSNSCKSLLKISAVINGDSVSNTKEQIIAYFEKDNNLKTLSPGNVILFNQPPQQIRNNGNPFEFDYKKYLARKRIYRQVYLTREHWKKTNKTTPSLNSYAEQIREKLLAIYKNQSIGETELEILSALTLGDKRTLDPEIKRIFSSAGAMHVLAVSGLHVGILFWVISLLLGFLRKNRSGKVLFVIISIILLWSFAFITGFSSSVLRAATMFSIFIIGENINRKANIYNSLAASALILLLFNPNCLFEIGFQLSYSAVFGIVFLQPQISGLIKVENRILKFFWDLLIVSVAAQIATFPITIYYFSQFPTYFWLTNIVIIPAVMILIPMGIFLLAFSKIHFIALLVSSVLNFLTKATYYFLSHIEQLPNSTLQFSINQTQFIFIISILVFVLLFLKNHRAVYLKFTLISVLLLFIFTSLNFYQRNITNEFIVYNSSKNAVIQLIHGNTNYIISKNKISPDDYIIREILNTNTKLHLHPSIYLTRNDTVTNSNLFLKNGLIFFEGKTIVWERFSESLNQNFKPDFYVNPATIKDSTEIQAKTQFIVTNIKLSKNLSEHKLAIHHTFLNGAFRKKW